MITKERLDKIKVLAFDLDGTLLNPEKKLTEGVRAALMKATQMGYHVVIATGRVLSSLPETLTRFPGIQYAVTSNGARIVDLVSGETIYESFLDEEMILQAMPLICDAEVMREIFFDGEVYSDRSSLANLPHYGITNPVEINYHLTTRTPVDDTAALLAEHTSHMENINLFIGDIEKRNQYAQRLAEFGFSVVGFSAHNIELGGPTTSKARALAELCELLGFNLENVMCFGDSTNDAAMVEEAGISIAMGNAVPQLKENADWVTLTNGEDGVSYALAELLDIRP